MGNLFYLQALHHFQALHTSQFENIIPTTGMTKDGSAKERYSQTLPTA